MSATSRRLSSAPLRLLLLSAVLLIAGCAQFSTLDPEPAPALPTQGLTDVPAFSAATPAPAPTEADLNWWQRFDDPALADWVTRALAANVDMAIAAERVQQAQALLQLARAQRGPGLGAQADSVLQLQREGRERRLQPGAALTLDFDVDLWGGLQQAERSAAAGLLRSQDLAQAARLATAGLTARAYIEWRLALQDHRLLDDGLALQRDALRVVSVRVEAGLSPVLDRDRAQAELAATQAEQASAGVRIGQSVAALQVLAGQRPQPMALSLLVPARDDALKLPALLGAQPLVRPLDLLRLRPDLRAAEQALIVAAADIGVAEAALRPSLRLPGTLIFGAAAAGAGVFELVSATLAAVLDVTLYDGGAGSAVVDEARSRAREAALLYRQTLLLALQQVEGALVSQQGARLRISARERASQAAQAAEAQAQTLYRAGLVGFLDVVDAQRSALSNQRALLQAQADAAAAAVFAFEAMGLI